MSSHAKPCYSLLSQYIQNGMNPILAPTPAETKPQMFAVYTPHEFSQNNYHLHNKMYGDSNNSSNRNLSSCIGYSNYSNIGCGPTRNADKDTNTFGPGFNEIGTSKYY